MTNTKLLKVKMILNNDTVSGLSKDLGIARTNASLKINGSRSFKQSEIAIITKKYNLTGEEVKEIFFNELEEVGA